MGFHDKMGYNGHISLKFDQFSKTVGVNSANGSLNVNSVNNMMPVVVNNDVYLNVCHDIKAMDTVSHVNNCL